MSSETLKPKKPLKSPELTDSGVLITHTHIHTLVKLQIKTMTPTTFFFDERGKKLPMQSEYPDRESYKNSIFSTFPCCMHTVHTFNTVHGVHFNVGVKSGVCKGVDVSSLMTSCRLTRLLPADP